MYILIVEDEEAVRKGLEAALTQKGHKIAWADNGEAAIRQLHKEDIDLILLDLILKPGGMSGWDVLRYRVEHDELAHISVIIVSGLSSSKIYQGASTNLLEGVIITLGKPVDFKLLFETIKELERRKKKALKP
jgi:DNA-binding response OmpR family regulator